jgi:hypothetical protein
MVSKDSKLINRAFEVISWSYVSQSSGFSGGEFSSPGGGRIEGLVGVHECLGQGGRGKNVVTE